jgi:hypothetical protein
MRGWPSISGSNKSERSIEMSFSEKIKIVFSNIWAFIGPFVKVFASAIGPVLASAAEQAVKEIAVSTLSGDQERRDAAFSKVSSDLKEKGIAIGVQVTTSMINAAIEAAVQKLKATE